MKTASRILRELVRSGMSQAEISRAIEVHHSQVSRWLVNDPPRHSDAILRMAKLHTERMAAKGKAS